MQPLDGPGPPCRAPGLPLDLQLPSHVWKHQNSQHAPDAAAEQRRNSQLGHAIDRAAGLAPGSTQRRAMPPQLQQQQQPRQQPRAAVSFLQASLDQATAASGPRHRHDPVSKLQQRHGSLPWHASAAGSPLANGLVSGAPQQALPWHPQPALLGPLQPEHRIVDHDPLQQQQQQQLAPLAGPACYLKGAPFIGGTPFIYQPEGTPVWPLAGDTQHCSATCNGSSLTGLCPDDCHLQALCRI